MKYELKEIVSHDKEQLASIVSLWCKSFGDSPEFVYSFFEKMPIHSTICFFDGDIPVSMAVLIDVSCGKRAYYGYAVCTDERYRKRGLCRMIHEYIREKCTLLGAEYFIHPASRDLADFYQRLGMEEISSYYDVGAASYENPQTYELSPSEYMRLRDLYFGGFNYYPWSESSLSFMKNECGISFVGTVIDSAECAAAVDNGNILELCAPDYLYGRAASTFLFAGGKLGSVRFIDEPNHADEVGIMSFSGERAYFNLFLE